MNLMKKFPITAENIAVILLFFAAFFLTLWRFGANQCFALASILVLLYRPWRQQLFTRQHFKKPIILVTLAFMALILISLSYSQVPHIANAVRGLAMYSKLLFLLVLPLAMSSSHCRYWLEQGLILGVVVNVVLTTLHHYGVTWGMGYFTPYFYYATFSVNPLQQIFVVVISCWILAQRLVSCEFHKSDIVLLVGLSAYLWLINIERSGYLIYVVLLLVLLYQRLNKKGMMIGLVAIPVLCFGLYTTMPNVKMRVDAGIADITAFNPHNTGSATNDTSLGLRLTFAKEGLKVISAHPFLGMGIGSYKYVYANIGGPHANEYTEPHNAYVLVAFELGLIGLGLYLLWLGVILAAIKKLPKVEGHLLQGFWWALVVMGFTDSSLILNAVGLSFVLFLSLYARKELI